MLLHSEQPKLHRGFFFVFRLEEVIGSDCFHSPTKEKERDFLLDILMAFLPNNQEEWCPGSSVG